MPTDGPPLDSPDWLIAALREQDLPEEEARALAPTLALLASWEAPAPTPADTARLVRQLAPLVPSPSPVRAALRARPSGVVPRLRGGLDWVVLQASLFRPWFWLSSAAIVVLGLALISRVDLSASLVLELVGPALSYLAVAAACRVAPARTLEIELACPVSAAQLTLTRLLVVLGYDVALGLGLSLALRASPGVGVLALSLHWLAPLLLLTGLALLLSGRLGVHLALTVVTLIWVGATLAAQSALAPATDAGIATGVPALAMVLAGLVAIGLATLTADARTLNLLRHG